MNTTQVWVLSGAVVVLSTILGFAGKLIAQQVIKRLDSIIIELQGLTRITTIQEERIKTLHDNSMIFASAIAEHTNILTDHSNRLVKLEVTIENSSN